MILSRHNFTDYYELFDELHYFPADCIVSVTQIYLAEEPR